MAMRQRIGVTNRPMFIWCASPATSMLAIHYLQLQRATSLGASLRDSLWDSLGASLWDSLRDAWWGQHDSYWVSFYLFCRAIGVKYDDQKSSDLDLWRDVAESCGVWWCYENYVIVSERPTSVRMEKRDASEVLHCEDGPALAFADGWAVHAWHGTRVPAEWIEHKDQLDPSTALTWENLEQRRAACEILGWDRILKELNATIIDADPEPRVGTLLEVDLPDIGREKFLRVVCGTGRTFALPVPPEMTSALEANCWTYGIDPAHYQLEVRT